MATFHFDLRHIEDAGSLQVRAKGKRFELRPHTNATLAAAKQANTALAAIPPRSRHEFTHFADVDDQLVEGRDTCWVYVVRPEQPGILIPEVVLMAQHLPGVNIRAHHERRMRLMSLAPEVQLAKHGIRRRHTLHTGKLASLGISEAGAAETLQRRLDARKLVSSTDTAAGLVTHYPDLASVQPYTQTNVMEDHIFPDPSVNPTQYNEIVSLSQTIANTPSWSPVVPCQDASGKQIVAGYNYGGTPGNPEIKKGTPLYTNGLAPGVQSQAAAPTGGACQTASDDMSLQNQTWTPVVGTSSIRKQVDQRSPAQESLASTSPNQGDFEWTVSDLTTIHGVSVDSTSIKLDGTTFSIDSNNSYLRTLYTGYQLNDENGNPIGDMGLICSLGATNSIMGIPMPTEPTTLSLDMGTASSIDLYFGSMGTTNWTSEVSWRGACLTGLWQYGIPVIFIIAGKALDSTTIFNKIVNDPDLVKKVLGVVVSMIPASLNQDGQLASSQDYASSFADVVVSLLIQTGLEELGEWVAEEAGEGALTNAFGPAGWVMKLLSAALDIEEMAVTTGEVLSSPACVTFTVSRAIDVSLTLHPDPAHGEVGHPSTAVWPTVASNYIVLLQYQDGTSRQISGAMGGTTNDTPLSILFSTVPAGGTIRVIAGVYSANGWLAGTWQSDWMPAVANDGTTLALGDQNITENLVPLAPDTQYVFFERIVNDAGSFVWQPASVAGPPTATLASLNPGNNGTLAELVGITINDSVYQIGYCWRSSGQDLYPDSTSSPQTNDQLYAVQNLSVLASPSSALLTTNVGFTQRPAIAYTPTRIDNTTFESQNYVLDPRNASLNLRLAPLPTGSESQPGSFGFDQTLPSWGSFAMIGVDAMAVHPSDSVIACSWQDSKLMILDLPEQPVPDAQAPAALLVSGEGVRQGLVQGPKALTIAPDGRILVLESLNKRVQAFDTKGNPVPSFTPSPYLFTLATDGIADDLDKKIIPEVFQAELQSTGISLLFPLSDPDGALVNELNAGGTITSPSTDPLGQALALGGVLVAAGTTIQAVTSGSSWILTDPRKMQWQILLEDGLLSVYGRIAMYQMEVQKPKTTWLITDQYTGFSYMLLQSSGSPGTTEVFGCSSYFPLREPGETGTFLDMAIEAQGFIYVLSYANDGSKTTDYILDVYWPNGQFCFRTPDPAKTSQPQNIVAGRIAVDMFRNLYALTYEPLTGLSGGPQAGIAAWIPTPPLFSLAQSFQPDFNAPNVGVIIQQFQANGITLDNQTAVLTLDPDGTWEVRDGGVTYDVYLSAGMLQVYNIPA